MAIFMSAYIVSCHYETISQILTDRVQQLTIAYRNLFALQKEKHRKTKAERVASTNTLENL